MATKNDQILSALDAIMHRLAILESATAAPQTVVATVSAPPTTNGHATTADAQNGASGRFHCAWSSCSRLYVKTNPGHVYCGHQDCPATRLNARDRSAAASAAYNGLPLTTIQETATTTKATAKKTTRKGKAGRRKATPTVSKAEFEARQAALDAAKADATATHALAGVLAKIAESNRGAVLEGADRYYNAVNNPTADGKSGQLPVFEGFKVGDHVVLLLNSVDRVIACEYAARPTPPSDAPKDAPKETPKRRGRPSNASKNAATTSVAASTVETATAVSDPQETDSDDDAETDPIDEMPASVGRATAYAAMTPRQQAMQILEWERAYPDLSDDELDILVAGGEIRQPAPRTVKATATVQTSADPSKLCPFCHGAKHPKYAQDEITAKCAERQYTLMTGTPAPGAMDLPGIVAFTEWKLRNLRRVFSYGKLGYVEFNPAASSQEDAAIVAEERAATAEASRALASVSAPQKVTSARKTASKRASKNAPMVVDEVIKASVPKVASRDSGDGTLTWSRSASGTADSDIDAKLEAASVKNGARKDTSHPTPSVRATAGASKSATSSDVARDFAFGPGTYRGTILKRSSTDNAIFKFHCDKSKADGWLEIGAEYTSGPMARNLSKVKAGQIIEIDIRAGKTASGMVAPVVVAARRG
jgi:hypothetical protein